MGEIPARFLKNGGELLTEPLCEIINLSLSCKLRGSHLK